MQVSYTCGDSPVGAAPMTPYQSPYSASTRWLRGNLHGHTCCGRFMDISESGRMYARLGYDFVSVTDHNKTWNAQQILGWEQAAGLTVVPGEENGATDHIVELGVHQVATTPSTQFADRAAALRGNGGFVMACHPQEYPHGEQNVIDGARSLHAVEIYNGLRELLGKDERKNIAIWDRLLTRGEKLWAAATDDFHCQHTTPGHGWVCVQAPATDWPITWQFIVDQLKAGAFFASTGPSFHRLSLDDKLLHVEADRHVHRLRVIGPGGQTLVESDGSKLDWTAPTGLSYFRVEADCGVKRAWSQPFFAA